MDRAVDWAAQAEWDWDMAAAADKVLEMEEWGRLAVPGYEQEMAQNRGGLSSNAGRLVFCTGYSSDQYRHYQGVRLSPSLDHPPC